MTSPSEHLERYSYTKLTTFEECPYQYWLNYVLTPDQYKKHFGNAREADKENNAFAEYGSAMHKILERYAKNELALFELEDEFAKAYSTEIKHEFPSNQYVDLAEQYYSDGMEFLSAFNGFDDYEILGVEHEIGEEIDFEHGDNFVLKGYIDLLYRQKSDGALVIHDWKSKAKFASRAEQAKYARQLYTYAIYTYRQYGVYPDILRFYCFRKQLQVDIPFNIGDYKKTWKWVNKTVAAIRECEMFETKQSQFMCAELCDYRNICTKNDIGFLEEG